VKFNVHLVGALAVVFIAVVLGQSGVAGAAVESPTSIPETVTFSEHVAPILFRHCTPCHRPGQPVPFTLLNYGEAASKADRIDRAVTSRRMPPWQADPFCGPFANARLLTTNEMQLISRWVARGTPEGDRKYLPPTPTFTQSWQLGPPDLVVPTPAAYRLNPSTNDTYYNLVLPMKLDRPRFVRAVEFSPGAAGTVHHAFIRFDRSGRCRKLASESGSSGFPGIHLPSGAFSSDSQFLSWQPGRRSSDVPAGMAWQLQPGTDVVLQLHLPAVSAAVDVQPTVAFYFTDEPPIRRGYKVRLTSFTFSIPPGATNCVVREEFKVPIATTLVSLLPHAHRLARRVQVSITPPGLPTRNLLNIPMWDFEWQTDYNFNPELPIAAGTLLSMEFSYINPNPFPVGYGPNTSDEMAELWVLFAVNSPDEYAAMAKAESPMVIRDTLAYNEYRLKADPRDWRALMQMANALLTRGDTEAALIQFERAETIVPNESEPHYWAGFALRQLKRVEAAEARFNEAIRCDPKNWQAHGTLGLISLDRHDYGEATRHFRAALEINPGDRLARQGLAKAEAGINRR